MSNIIYPEKSTYINQALLCMMEVYRSGLMGWKNLLPKEKRIPQ